MLKAVCRRPCASRHTASEKVFVDYAGQTIDMIDGQTGEVHDRSAVSAITGHLELSDAGLNRQSDLLCGYAFVPLSNLVARRDTSHPVSRNRKQSQ